MTQQQDSDEAIQKAWKRIQGSEWDQMNWFVKLANTDLTTISEGDLLNWRDEFRAMLRGGAFAFSLKPDPPSLEEMLKVKLETERMLWGLARGLERRTQDVFMQYAVRFVKTSPEQEKAGYPRYQIYKEAIGTPQRMYEGPLGERLTELLEQYVNGVRQCPHCEKLFLQVRSDGRYCSRRCHSVAGMRIVRNAKQLAKATPKTKTKIRHRSRSQKSAKTPSRRVE